jgi:hypothetical protein
MQTKNLRLESRVRRLAQREGYRLHKSRRRLGIDNEGEFMLVDNDANFAAMGQKFDATLDDIERFLTEEEG